MIYRINVIGNTNNACAIRFMKPNMKYVHVKIIQSNIFNTMTAQPLAIFRLYFSRETEDRKEIQELL